MKLFKGPDLVTGLAIGLGAMIVGPAVLRLLSEVSHALAKNAIKGGLIAYDKSRFAVDGVRDVADNLTSGVTSTARGVTAGVASTARDLAEGVTSRARDLAEGVTSRARDLAAEAKAELHAGERAVKAAAREAASEVRATAPKARKATGGTHKAPARTSHKKKPQGSAQT